MPVPPDSLAGSASLVPLLLAASISLVCRQRRAGVPAQGTALLGPSRRTFSFEAPRSTRSASPLASEPT